MSSSIAQRLADFPHLRTISQHRLTPFVVFPLSPTAVECSIKTAALRSNIEPPGMARRSPYVAKRALAPFL